MSENPISISNLNDFIFCPVSIYFHSLDDETEKITYQCEFQINGSAAHEAVDNGRYSDKKAILQSTSVYCDKYGVYGKIDTFDVDRGVLTERKKRIQTVFDGYVFQLYAQYFALSEMGYKVKELRLYSSDDNKVYPVLLPEKDLEMYSKFESLINEMQTFNFNNFKQTNPLKCKNCIYEPLCSFSTQEG